MFMTQEVQIIERPLRPGDIFADAEGVVWAALNPVGPPIPSGPLSEREPTHASVVWHLPDATKSRDEDEFVEIKTLPQPFRFIFALSEVK